MPFKRGTRYPLFGVKTPYYQRVMAKNPTCYWPLWDASGSTHANAIVSSINLVNNDGVFGSQGIGDGKTGIQLSGANTNLELGSAAFNAVWNGDYGAAITWQKVDAAARWTDSSTYRWCFHPRASDDDTYYICFGKTSTNHQIQWRRRSGGAITSVAHTFSPAGPTDWFAMGMTWNLAVPEIRCFLDGEFIGTAANGFTTFGAHPIDSASCAVLYAGSLTLQEWIGWGAHCIYWNSLQPDSVMRDLTRL